MKKQSFLILSLGIALSIGPLCASPLTLGNYPDTLVSLSGDTMVMPDAVPAGATSINVSTDSNFQGTFAANPTTGVVTVTDAHPAGTYAVTVTAFGPGGTTTKTFALTVTNSAPCGANLTDGFGNAADLNVRPNAWVAIGDFNGDGTQDLAVAHGNDNVISIHLGTGLGGFSGSTNVIVGNFDSSLAIGDFNGDGKQDLALANYGSATVSIRLGDGLGGFSSSTNVSVGSYPHSVVIGDFNGDGKQDFAVANESSGTISVRLGDGLGGFSGSTEVNLGSQPRFLVIGDFNGDGKQDLAVANYYPSTVSIFLGDGLGGFSGSTEVSVGSYPLFIAIGDFNGDGRQDLAVAHLEFRVSIRLGDGLGGFSGSTEVDVGNTPRSLAIGDFNYDGKQDLVVANSGSDTVSIALGDGLGGFGSSTQVTVGANPQSVVIGDFNGDGKQDLAVGDYESRVSIRLGHCFPVATGDTRALDLSTRLLVGTGNSVGIAGFIITGTGPRQVLVRGIGFSSSIDPALELHGMGSFQTITNNNWIDTQEAEIIATGIAPTNTLDSAILALLDPGPYTAILKDNLGSGGGVGLVEVYDLAQGAGSKLGNISTRAFVSTGSDIVIAGFILGGSRGNDDLVIVRGIGPSLAQAGLSPVLANPFLELRATNGELVVSNNDWQEDATAAAIITAVGLAPSDPLESGIVATLAPGAYTAVLSGGSGLGLVEVYDNVVAGPTPTPAGDAACGGKIQIPKPKSQVNFKEQNLKIATNADV